MSEKSLPRLRQALERQQAGRLEEAEAIYREVLQAEPANADALNLLGSVELQRGRLVSAVEWIEKAVRVAPKTPLYHYNLGAALLGLAKHTEAAGSFKRAVALKPDFFEAHLSLGDSLMALGQIEEAISAYEKAAGLRKHPALLNNLGAALLKRRDLDGAVRRFEEALQIQPDHPDALYNLGMALQEQGRHADAIAPFARRAALPQPPAALPFQLGVACEQTGRMVEAENYYRQALVAQPTALVCGNLGVVLEHRFAFDEAEAMLRRALEYDPHYAEAWSNLGNVLLATGRTEAAEAAYDRAIELRPDYATARHNRAHARLAQGKFTEGWKDHEHRWQSIGFPNRKPKFAQPEWTGDDLRGRTLLVYNEQGLGDTIQFARYLALVARRGGRVLFACPPELRTLFEGIDGVSAFIEPEKPLPAFDTHAALMSLPYLCGTTIENVPARVPYLPLAPTDRVPLGPRTAKRPRVGLVWAGGTKFRKDGLRSMTAQEALPPLLGAECDFFSLQVGPKAAQLRALPEAARVVDLSNRLRDFADTAAVMLQLDLVISTCTSTLHLAGALGRPVWGLLSYAPDWRWMRDREDSPWYPTMRLFRQSKPGDWPDMLRRVRAALDALS